MLVYANKTLLKLMKHNFYLINNRFFWHGTYTFLTSLLFITVPHIN